MLCVVQEPTIQEQILLTYLLLMYQIARPAQVAHIRLFSALIHLQHALNALWVLTAWAPGPQRASSARQGHILLQTLQILLAIAKAVQVELTLCLQDPHRPWPAFHVQWAHTALDQRHQHVCCVKRGLTPQSRMQTRRPLARHVHLELIPLCLDQILQVHALHVQLAHTH